MTDSHLPQHYTGYSASEQGVQDCHTCATLNTVGDTVCHLCGSAMHPPAYHRSYQHTVAWLLTSIVLYIPANLLPIMNTRLLGKDSYNTILGGVVTLWEHGSYPIALIIFIASVLVPVGKIIALGWLCIAVRYQQRLVDVGPRDFLDSNVQVAQTKLYRLTEIIGRWSMIDVFVVVILVALIQLGNIMTIYPGFAALAFGGMVITTMFAAIAFDPRALWLQINSNRKNKSHSVEAHYGG